MPNDVCGDIQKEKDIWFMKCLTILICCVNQWFSTGLAMVIKPRPKFLGILLVALYFTVLFPMYLL